MWCEGALTLIRPQDWSELLLRKGSKVMEPMCLKYIEDVRKSVLITWLRLLGRTEVKLKLIEQTAGTFGKV